MSISHPAWRNAPLGALSVCASLLCLGVGQTARADAPARPHLMSTINMPPAPTHAVSLSPRARKTARIQPSSNWVNIGLATDAVGYSYSLWDYAPNGTMAEWTYAPDGSAYTEGPTYGPYADSNGTWAPVAIGVNPSTYSAKILWDRSDGAAGVWSMDQSGNAVAVGPTFGPFTDWQAIGIATAGDGTSDILWERSDGAMGIWVVDANGQFVGEGPVYGPYANGSSHWFPVSIGTNPTDYTARIVWEYTDGTTGFWSLDPSGTYITGQANTYGPFSDSGGNWDPIGIATSGDGNSDVLWARSDGTEGIWNLDGSLNVTNVGPTYGPFSDSSGTYAPEYNGIGIDPNPNDTYGDQARVLWNRSDGATGLWGYQFDGTALFAGSVYGPFN